MRAGQLRHQITLQQAVESQDAYGAVTVVWSDVATVRAAYEPQSGKEAYAEAQQQAEAVVRFRIRYRAGIVPKMRILFDGRVFDIQSVIDVYGRRKQLQLMAIEHV